MALRLGTETGSAVNHLMSGHVGGPAPVVGMGATILMWTDRNGATVVKVSPSGKTVTVRRDKATRTDSNGMSESQTWEHTPNPNGAEITFRLTARGWTSRGMGLRLGERSTYHDFSF